MIPAKEYIARRERFFSMMERDSAALIYSGVPKVRSADDTYPFEVNRNFYYLTGIDQEDSILFMVNADGERHEFLFVLPYDANKERWYGRRLTLDEAREISGINNVLVNNALNPRIEGAFAENYAQYGELNTLYLDLDDEIKVAANTSTHEIEKIFKEKYPHIKTRDAYPLITTLRLRKSPCEIEEFRKAIATTKLGIMAVISEMRPGVKEYELADLFLKVINDDSGYQGLSFNTIMASGKNAVILHYPKPLSTLEDGDLLMMDLGARCGYYNADVSRTFPISGKFNPTQKALYNIVLGANKLVASMARPGVTVNELQSAVKTYMAEECLAQGFLKDKGEIDSVYYHSVSHLIGLDTHDPYLSPVDRKYKDMPLEPGMVISDEPGLYFANLGIGIRIEDDLLITDEGAEVLTKDIIKEADEIERFFASSNNI